MKDLLSRIGQWTEKMWRSIPIHLRDAIFTALLLGIAAAICFVLRSIDENGSFTLLIFVLAVVIISRFTEGYFWGVFSSLFGVICVNFVFTYPFWAFNFTLTGYPLTFLTMLAVSLIISAMNTKIKKQERLRTEAERETMRANLLRAMSHDIRTPLTSIVGNTSAILENGDTLSTEQQRELLRDVNEDAQWLIRIVENLLSITRISSEEAKVKKEPEPAEEVIESAVAKTHKHYPEVDIRVHLPDELMMVPMDPLLMEQVLVNLMENAVIHGETHHIDVTLSSEGNCAVFTVADDGRGIPLHLLPRLFDGSARSDRSSDGKRSMGIGLSVCRTIVLAHGGVIRGDNRQEGGAVFTVTLPMKGENDED